MSPLLFFTPVFIPPVLPSASRNINHILRPGSRNASQDATVRARAFTHERAGRRGAARMSKITAREKERAEGGAWREGVCAPLTEPRGDSSPG